MGTTDAAAALAPLVMTDEQVGQVLLVSTDCVRNLHRMGQLRGVLIGRHLRWRRADVEKFVSGLKAGGTE